MFPSRYSFEIRFRSFVDFFHISIFNYAICFTECDAKALVYIMYRFCFRFSPCTLLNITLKCIFNGWSSFYNLRRFIKFFLKIYGFMMLRCGKMGKMCNSNYRQCTLRLLLSFPARSKFKSVESLNGLPM